MASFYVTEKGLLVSIGTAPDGQEELQAGPGQKCHLGEPPGFDRATAPYPDIRWHVEERRWVDLRTSAQQQVDAQRAVRETRRAQYPDVTEFADAMYWASQGDHSKLDAYLAAVAAVKARNPKI